jgi:hypothetical protein
MQVRLPALIVAVGAVVALNGCDSTSIKAQFANVDSPNTVVYALNGTPATFPAALLFRGGSSNPVRVDANFLFDVAFDLNATGEVKVYTMRAVASQFVAGHRVGLLTDTTSFANVKFAPTSGYKYDSSMVVPVGRTVLVDVIEQSCSPYLILGQNIHAKFVIDSVKATTRTIYVHFLANLNCGFTSLGEGLPEK